MSYYLNFLNLVKALSAEDSHAIQATSTKIQALQREMLSVDWLG